MSKPGLFGERRSRPAIVLVALLGLALLVGWSVAFEDARASEDRRLTLLQIEARRKSIEVMSSTLNGNLMGAITLLGLTHVPMKREVLDAEVGADPQILTELRSLGRAFGANGVFVVGKDGVIRSSWDWGDKPSTGLDVRFRPYFMTAMAGKTNVYAAISVSQGERALYFAAPVVDAQTQTAIGVVVARTDFARVDKLLMGDFDKSLLLSPQEVVFAGSQAEWIGKLAGEPTAERMAAIRQIRQFGKLFERSDPPPLPFSVERGIQPLAKHRHAVASAEVTWNDPAGAWTLVLMENLDRSVPASRLFARGGLASALTLLVGLLMYRLWRVRLKQRHANAQLREFAAQQEATAVFRAELSRLAARLQRCEQLPELAEAFLLSAREMLGAMQGAVYAASSDAPSRLLLIGSSAAGEALPKVVEMGQGLLGQCGLDRRRLVLDTPPPGPWRLRSGLGHAMPGALVLAPLVLHEELVGMVELALLRPPDAAQQEQLDDLLGLLTNSLEILRRSERAWLALRGGQDVALEVDT